MPIIAGIDEAGYGPLLGPLVITSTIFDLPGHCKDDLWSLLKDAVSREIKGRNNRIVVNDSKRVYSPSIGLRLLEDAVLSFMYYLRGGLKSFRQLLSAFSDTKTISLDLDIYPWYCEKDILFPVVSSPSDILRHAGLLKDVLDKNGVRLLDIQTIPIPVYNFNKEIRQTGNKGVLLFNNCARLLMEIWEKFGEMSPTIYIDKHGGRDRYLPLLYKVFEGCYIKIVKEGRTESIYEVLDKKKSMVISFIQDSETSYFPIALASMCCKYIRELFILLFNSFWQEKVPGIRPTAGYYQDGQRFLNQIAAVKRALGIKDELIIRLK